MTFDDCFTCDLFFETIMGKSKQKLKSTREPQLLTNSIVSRKRDEQDVVNRMVMTSLESKTRVDVYGNVKTSSMMPLMLSHG